ncbi:universal stress protein [Fodinicola acaciae]|uniref:universal stress protein n=1 Tax=Fodinicola acaciae TaxID=2681555 RepID=UPI0013D0DC98|nr:universal stress protein [Fodinicola acaciae]
MTAPIVVGVNGRDSNDDAVRWAARQAVVSGRRLRLVAAIWSPEDGDIQLLTDSQATTARMVDSAARLVRQIAPAVGLSAELRIGNAVDVLLEQSRDAWITVIGRENGWTAEHMVTNVAAANLIGQQGSPIAVINAGFGLSRPGSPITVGVDGSPASYAAAEFAADLARILAAPIELLSATPSVDGGSADAHAQHVAAELMLADLAGQLLRRGPLPPIHATVRPASAVAALLERSRRSRLLVLGTRGHSTATAAGPVCQSVVDLADCPVVVVNPAVAEARTPCRGSVVEAGSA